MPLYRLEQELPARVLVQVQVQRSGQTSAQAPPWARRLRLELELELALARELGRQREQELGQQWEQQREQELELMLPRQLVPEPVLTRWRLSEMIQASAQTWPPERAWLWAWQGQTTPVVLPARVGFEFQHRRASVPSRDV